MWEAKTGEWVGHEVVSGDGIGPMTVWGDTIWVAEGNQLHRVDHEDAILQTVRVSKWPVDMSEIHWNTQSFV